MTDREKILAEIERLRVIEPQDLNLPPNRQWMVGKDFVCLALGAFIDSMPEEPLTHPVTKMSDQDTYEKFVKTFISMVEATHEHSGSYNLREFAQRLYGMVKEVPQAPVSEDLEEAADKYVSNWYKKHDMEMEDYPIDVNVSKMDFKAGAAWQHNKVWHTASDKPKPENEPTENFYKQKMLVIHNENIAIQKVYDFHNLRNIKMWAYIEDLLPTE